MAHVRFNKDLKIQFNRDINSVKLSQKSSIIYTQAFVIKRWFNKGMSNNYGEYNMWCCFLQSFNEYFSAEHSRLLSLWRAVVAFRRQFSEMKASTERDISHMRSDVTRAARSMHSACLNLSANERSRDTQLSVQVDRERTERSELEQKLREKTREVLDLQSQYDSRITEINAK